MSLLNKIAIVTGASSGIGAAIAIKLTKQLAKVAIVGRNSEKLKTVSEECEKIGAKPLSIIADVTKDEDAKRIVNETIDHFDKLDILVNNAGIVDLKTSLEREDAMEVYDKIMATNIRSAVHLTHLSVKHLAKSKGNIVNISSNLALVPSVPFSYCTSKAALDHFSRSAAFGLAHLGIRVNVINPGPVRTRIFSNNGYTDAEEEELWKKMPDHTLLKRVGEPEDIAELVAFIASEKARSMTGANIVSDNGGSLTAYARF